MKASQKGMIQDSRLKCRNAGSCISFLSCIVYRLLRELSSTSNLLYSRLYLERTMQRKVPLQRMKNDLVAGINGSRRSTTVMRIRITFSLVVI